MKPPALYVQYQPIGDSKIYVEELQQQFISGRPVPADELHVTVLHFGFLDETFKQLQAMRPELDRQRYDQAVHIFARELKPRLPEQCQLTVTGLDTFGPKCSVLVLTLDADEALTTAYQVTMKQLHAFGQSISIKNIADIPSQPRALQIQDKLSPHLSLAKGVHDIGPLPDIAGKQLTLELSPLE